MIATAHPSRGLAWLLVVAAVASALAAALTFFLSNLLNGPAVMNGSARGTALIMLVGGVPLLLASFAIDRGGSPWTLPVRFGALAYLAYNGFLLLFATPFNRLFLIYVVALSVTVFSLGSSLVQADASAVRERLRRTSARVIGGYIWLIVVLNSCLWLTKVVSASVAPNPMSFLDGTGIATNPVYVQDLVFWLPSAAVIGWLVWTRRPWGALLAGGYLVYGVLEAIGVATDQWFGSTADPSSEVATMGAVYIFAVLAVIGAGALLFYGRALASGSPAEIQAPGTSLVR